MLLQKYKTELKTKNSFQCLNQITKICNNMVPNFMPHILKVSKHLNSQPILNSIHETSVLSTTVKNLFHGTFL